MRFPGLAVVMSVLCLGADWPQFRGPTADGQVVGSVPAIIDPAKSVLWKTPVPGFAWSSPVIVGDCVFVTSADADALRKPKAPDFSPMVMLNAGKPPDTIYRWSVVCLDRATGSPRWSKLVAERKPPIAKHPTNTFATETPAADDRRVYAVFGTLGLVIAFDHAGVEQWRYDMGVHPMAVGFGTGSSPVLAEGKLFVQWDNEEKSRVIALDPSTGKEVWVADRSGKTSWASPLYWKSTDRAELVTCGDGRVTSYDPATGKVLWEASGFKAGFTGSPVADAKQVYFGNSGPGTPGLLWAVKAGATGNLTPPDDDPKSPSVAWKRTKAGPGMPSPVLLDGRLYIASQSTLSCYDCATGEPVYAKERLPRSRGITATPLVAGGKLYVVDENGRVFRVTPGPKLDAQEVAQIEDGLFWSSPAAVDGKLYIRGSDHVFCIGP